MTEMGRKEKHLRQTMRRNRISEVNDLFRIAVDERNGFQRAGELWDNFRERGKGSEKLVESVLRGMPEVSKVRTSSEFEDRECGSDLIAVIEDKKWRIQVKSSKKGVDETVKKKMSEWKSVDGPAVTQKMAQKGWMVINGRMEEDEGNEKVRIEEQIRWWMRLGERERR